MYTDFDFSKVLNLISKDEIRNNFKNWIKENNNKEYTLITVPKIDKNSLFKNFNDFEYDVPEDYDNFLDNLFLGEDNAIDLIYLLGEENPENIYYLKYNIMEENDYNEDEDDYEEEDLTTIAAIHLANLQIQLNSLLKLNFNNNKFYIGLQFDIDNNKIIYQFGK